MPPLWSFDGNFESPSFGPSLRMIGGNGCHLFVQQGQILYCPDSQHAMAGKTVPMVDWDLERWCPVGTLHTLNGKPLEVKEDSGSETVSLPPPAIPRPTGTAERRLHPDECGDVGIVGDIEGSTRNATAIDLSQQS